VFTFEAQEGRLFKPPALTKTFATGEARTALDHAGAGAEAAFVRGRILAEIRNPINRALIWLYRPAIASVLRARPPTILLAVLVLETPLPQQELLITGRLQMRLECIKKARFRPRSGGTKTPKSTCVNSRRPLTNVRRPVWVRLSGLRSSAIVRPCLPSQSMSDALRIRAASYMLLGVLANGVRYGQMV